MHPIYDKELRDITQHLVGTVYSRKNAFCKDRQFSYIRATSHHVRSTSLQTRVSA